MKIGLALSGGGAKGFAHAGALHALRECGIEADVVAGTSAGAIIGAFYCAGCDMEKVIEIFLRHDVNNFIKMTVPKVGFFNSEGFLNFLETELPENFEDLKISLRVVATDFENGTFTVFTEGKLAPRVMASSSLPIFLKPQEIDGVHYVDGGIFKNFPASVVRDDCDFLIGINVSPKLHEKYKNNILYIASRSYNYLFKANMEKDLAMCDVLVEVEEALQYKAFELKKAKEIFNLGYESMKEELGKRKDIIDRIR